MSTASLPGYAVAPAYAHTPLYTAEPREDEQRLAHVRRFRPRPTTVFEKESRHGDVRLRLAQQPLGVQQPVFGSGSTIEGAVRVEKPDGVTSVEVKIEGTLDLQEIGEGGTTSAKILLNRIVLWVKDRTQNSQCPPSLPFKFVLPSTFKYGSESYPLPPTYEVHLSGLPGFRASIDYSIGVTVNKPSTRSVFGVTIGNTSVSTHFTYLPRTRPAVPLPVLLQTSQRGLVPTGDWKLFTSRMQAKMPGTQDIVTQLYLPASRVFSVREPIPFHLVFSSSAYSLAIFLPFGPNAHILFPNKQYTQIEVLRQSAVDVRNAVLAGTKTDIWRLDRIGEGIFRHANDGPDWISYTGEIRIAADVTMGGFRAGGLTVKDCVVFNVEPPDGGRSTFASLRQVVPVRLTTDAWMEDGSGIGVAVDGSGVRLALAPDETASLFDYRSDEV